MRLFQYLCVLTLLPLACTSRHSPAKSETSSTGGLSIVGEWSGQARNGPLVRFIFGPHGVVTLFQNNPGFYQAAPSGLHGRYSLRPSFPSYRLDMNDFSEPRFANYRLSGMLRPISESQVALDFPPMAGVPRSEFTGKEIILIRR
jgi:hypothetical protein